MTELTEEEKAAIVAGRKEVAAQLLSMLEPKPDHFIKADEIIISQDEPQ